MAKVAVTTRVADGKAVTIGREAFGARGELGEMRRSRRIDEIAPQTIEDHEDNTLHVNRSDNNVMIVITTDAHAAHDPATMAPSPSGRPFYDRAARVDQLLGGGASAGPADDASTGSRYGTDRRGARCGVSALSGDRLRALAGDAAAGTGSAGVRLRGAADAAATGRHRRPGGILSERRDRACAARNLAGREDLGACRGGGREARP